MNQRARIQRLKPESTSPFLSDFSFSFFVRVEEQWRPCSYLILMKELVERPILSDSSSSSRTPSFRLRGLTKHTHLNTHMNRHSLTHTHSSVQRFKEDLWVHLTVTLSASASDFLIWAQGRRFYFLPVLLRLLPPSFLSLGVFPSFNFNISVSFLSSFFLISYLLTFISLLILFSLPYFFLVFFPIVFFPCCLFNTVFSVNPFGLISDDIHSPLSSFSFFHFLISLFLSFLPFSFCQFFYILPFSHCSVFIYFLPWFFHFLYFPPCMYKCFLPAFSSFSHQFLLCFFLTAQSSLTT